MTTPLQFTAADVVLRPITDVSEIPELVDLCMRALESDPLVPWTELYTDHTERESTITKLNEAFRDPTCSIWKAVVPPGRHEGDGELLVGFTNWMCGYIQLDKVDPFAPKDPLPANTDAKGIIEILDAMPNAAQEVEETVEMLHAAKQQSEEDEEKARRLKFGDSVFVNSRNHYITAIRGKKHLYIRRIMVDPQYQRRGIAAKILKFLTDEADRKRIVCWLFTRPAGEALYRKHGFKEVGVTEMSDGDLFYCPRAFSMIRPRKQ